MAEPQPRPTGDEVNYRDVTVIGAGWSGLLCTKYMLEEGLTVATLEKRDNLGGVWYYSDDTDINTVMKTTYATSSTTVTEMSDFPMPDDKGHFLHHSDMLEYLHSFAKNFNLLPHIHFNRVVTSVVKNNDYWHVSVEGKLEGNNEVVYISKYLAVATGSVDRRNNEPRYTIFKNFSGKIYHAGELKEYKSECEGCRLLIHGGGETASDICLEWHEKSSVIYWNIPRGQHFFRKFTKVLPWRKPQVLDKVSSRMITTIAPYQYSKPGLAWICKWTTNGSLLAYQGHGIPEWRNSSDFLHYAVNKSGKVLDLIDYKTVYPKGGIEKCCGKTVTFSDGEVSDFDVIILSTGYSFDHSIIRDSSKQMNRYKFVFDNDDPSIAFVGYVRPVVGSIPVVSEIQARWAARVFSNKISLPPTEQRILQTEKDGAFWDNYFKNSSRRNEQLVEGFIYIDDIAKEAKIYPDCYRLFQENKYDWYVSMISPFNSSFYRLNETKHRKSIIRRLQKHREQTISPLHLLLLVFLRLIWFDWILKQLEKVKYSFQTSTFANKLAKTTLVLFVNSIWCTPKQLLFGKK